METNERASLYTQFLEAAAKEYRCATTDMPAKMAATRRLSFEVYQARLIEGRDVDPATLRWFLEEETRYAPQQSPLKVEVAIVDGLVGICPHCKAEVHPYEPPPALSRLPVLIETKDVSKTETSLPPKPPASNVVEMRPGASPKSVWRSTHVMMSAFGGKADITIRRCHVRL
jgi:hypothetical protein